MPEFWMCLMHDVCMMYIHKVTVQIVKQLSKHRRIQNIAKHLRWTILQKARGGCGTKPLDKGTS